MNPTDAFPLSLALEALGQLSAGRPADRVLDRLLRSNRGLGSLPRGQLARRVLGIACLRGRLDYVLEQRAAGWQSDPERHRLAAWLVLEERLSAEDASRLVSLPEGLLHGLAAGPVRWPEAPVERLAAMGSLPRWLAGLWFEQLGEERSLRLAEATNRPGPIAVRANRLRTTREDLRVRLADEGVQADLAPFAPDGLVLRGRVNVFGSPSWRAGLFEVQDEGSQLIAALCGATPGERIVDFCAGAGGKTLALAAAMGNRGRLLAFDVDARRLADLTPRLARAGVQIAEAARLEPEGPPPAVGDADCVLVDAPCSSLGTLRRGPDVRWRIDPRDVAAFPARQRAILERAAGLVRSGGRLVYATCTLNRCENEEVARDFEAAHPEFARSDLAAMLGPELAARLGTADALAVAPDTHGTDGFFAVAWRRAPPGIRL